MENAGIQPVMPVGGYGDGWSGGCGCFMWIILLFALMGGGAGGWGNRGMATQADVYAANDMQDMKANQRQIMTIGNNLGNGLADLGYALNTGILTGFANTQRDISNGTYVIDKAITDTRYVIGNAVNENRFAAQQNANMIARAIADDGDKTRALIINNQMDNLRMALAEKDRLLQTRDFELSQCYQTNTIKTDVINAVRPFPVPAFQVGNPYGNCSCNCGVNYGCQ